MTLSPPSSPETPAGLVLTRAQAFRQGEFGTIWDSSHPASNFRRMFPERAGYLAYGQTVLAADFDLVDCRVLRQETRGRLARVLSLQVFHHDGSEQAWFEYARLRHEDGRWQVLATARLERNRFPGPAEDLDWPDFERLDEGGFF